MELKGPGRRQPVRHYRRTALVMPISMSSVEAAGQRHPGSVGTLSGRPARSSPPRSVFRSRIEALVPELECLREQFEQVAAEATALASGLRDDQFAWRPTEGAWSVGECLAHLNAAATLCLPKLDDGIAEGVRHGAYADGPFRYSWLDRLTVRLAEPSSRVRIGSPDAFLPATGGSCEQVLSAFREFQVQFIARLHRANGLDLVRARVASPVSAWRRFSLGAGFALIAAHQRRHLAQARKIIGLPQFPR